MYEEYIEELNKWFEDEERYYSTYHTDEEYCVDQSDVDDFCDLPQGRQVRFIKCEVLDKIRAEIDEQYDRVYPYDISCAEGLEMALGIIDKYKAESEEV